MSLKKSKKEKELWHYEKSDSLSSHLSPVQPDEQTPRQVPMMWSHDTSFRQFPHWKEHALPYRPWGHS